MLRKGATFTLPTKSRYANIMQGSRHKYYPKSEAWRFLPRHPLLDLAVESTGNNFAA